MGSEGDGLYVESDEGWSGDVRTYVATAMTKRGGLRGTGLIRATIIGGRGYNFRGGNGTTQTNLM